MRVCDLKIRKCHSKEFLYVVPTIKCWFCNKHIKPGDELFIVVLSWGDGRPSCKECYDKYEIDESIRKEWI